MTDFWTQLASIWPTVEEFFAETDNSPYVTVTYKTTTKPRKRHNPAMQMIQRPAASKPRNGR